MGLQNLIAKELKIISYMYLFDFVVYTFSSTTMTKPNQLWLANVMYPRSGQ